MSEPAGETPLTPAPEPASRELQRDARDLSRGVALNLLGYLLKLGTPVLTWLVIYCYGTRDFGVFVVAQATMMIAFRVCLLGFDKGLWWWIPRVDSGRAFSVLGGILPPVVGLGTIVSAACYLGAELLATWSREPEAAIGLRWLALSVVPMALLELLVAAAIGKRKLGAQVLIKDGFVPIAHLGFALSFYVAGVGVNGLPLAFVSSRVAGALLALHYLLKATDFEPNDLRPARLPRAFVAYSFPSWLTELGNSFVQRMDVLAMSAFTTPDLVGAYGATLQVGNTLKSVRQAFDPILLAILSEVSARADVRRLRASFSHATALLLATQLPLYVAILLFSTPLMGLLGPGYEVAASGVMVLAGFSLLNSVTGFHGHVVSAYGRSDLILLGLGVTGLLQAVLLATLVPLHGLVGATLAVGLSSAPTSFAWVFASRWLTRSSLYDARLRGLFGLVGVCSLLTLVTWFSVRSVDEALARPVTASVFALLYGLGMARLTRSSTWTGTTSPSATAQTTPTWNPG